MALPTALQDREQQKFVDIAPGQTAVRVSGTNFSGTFIVSGLSIAGKITEVTIDNTSWTALPATALTARNAISIQNRSGQEIKINYDNSIAGYVGIIIPDRGERYYDIQDIIIYAKSSTSSCTVVVEELA